jgi:hypothetical protein
MTAVGIGRSGAVYPWLRREAPVYYSEKYDFYALSRRRVSMQNVAGWAHVPVKILP